MNPIVQLFYQMMVNLFMPEVLERDINSVTGKDCIPQANRFLDKTILPVTYFKFTEIIYMAP